MSFFVLILCALAAPCLQACGDEFFEVHNSSATKILYFSTTMTAEPLNWRDEPFDDSAWDPPQPWTYNAPFDSPGWPYSAHDLSGTSVGGDGYWVRQSFDLPADAVQITGVLMLGVDDSMMSWINGVPIQADPDGMLDIGEPREFTALGLKPGRNTLALRVYSPEPIGIGFYFQVRVTYARACPELDSSPELRSYAFPQPAQGRVRIAFSMPEDGTAELKAFSLSGRLLSRVSQALAPGQRVLDLDLAGYAPGTYAYSLTLKLAGRELRLGPKAFLVTKP